MESEKTFTVLLFASLRDAAGADSVAVRLRGEPATVARLLRAVEEQCVALAKWLPHVRVAVNCAYAQPDLLLEPGDEIALIPPVAGGERVPT